MIYWVAIEEIPTKKQQEEEGQIPKLVFGPVAVSARDDKDAALKVALANPDALKEFDAGRLQVTVQSF